MNKLLADSNRAYLREIVESNADWGKTPENGTTRALRFTSSSITLTKETVVSDEIRDDRMVSSVTEVAAMSGGEIGFEFSAGNQDRALQRVLMGAWSRPMEFDVFRGQQVSVVANNQIAIAGEDLSAYFTIGRRVKTSGFKNAANNDYLELTAVAFAGGVTTLTVSGATLVAESGTAFTTVQDANDVVVRKSNALRFGTAGARTIDSNGTNAFAALIAAKQLVPGQMIFVEGVGYGTGTVTVADAAVDDSLSISDGVNAFVFTATDDEDDASNVDTFFLIGADDAETAANLAAKINAMRFGAQAEDRLNVSAKVAGAVVTVLNLNKVGGALTGDDASLAVVDFAGGNASLGGFYKIVSLTDDQITVDRAVPTVAATTNVTIKASMLRNPGRSADITPQSSTIETGFQDVSQFFVSDGLRFGNLSMEISANALITGSIALMGRATARRNTTKLGNAPYVQLEAPATENVSATANVGALLANGEELSTAIQSISLEIEGNLRNQQAVGNKFPVGISAGRLNITGTITAYFADGFMFDKFLNHDTVALAFPIIDQDKNTYWITIPAFKIMSDPIAPGGIDQDVMETLEFTAFRDAATKCMMQVDRFSSTAPVTAL